jgi:Tfp pilus assembly protein PilO
MKISSRELVLACITGAVVIVGGTWYFGAPLVDDWKSAITERRKMGEDRKLAERLIEQRPEWQQRYDELRAPIPKHGPNDPVTSEMLKNVKRLADQHGVTLSRIEPDKEKVNGDLAEVAIDCTWDSELEPLVRFLYAVQTQGAILDIRQLTIAPAQGVAGRLKGNFTVFFAFSREGAAKEPGKAAVPPGTPSPAG